MLSGALYPLEPPEYPPPYPPPLALAKETVGTPIKVITIIAAMSFVVFINFLSIDIADQSTIRHHPSRSSPRKTYYSRTTRLHLVLATVERGSPKSLYISSKE
jgi:hypothetical protein